MIRQEGNPQHDHDSQNRFRGNVPYNINIRIMPWNTPRGVVNHATWTTTNGVPHSVIDFREQYLARPGRMSKIPRNDPNNRK